MNITIKELGTHHELVVSSSTTMADVVTFTTLSINRTIACYIDNVRVWTHDNAPVHVFVSDRGYIRDNNATITRHAAIILQFIENHFNI